MKIDDLLLLWKAARTLTGKPVIVRIKKPWNKTTMGRVARTEYLYYIDLAVQPGRDPNFLWTFLHEAGHVRAEHITKASEIPLQPPETWAPTVPDPAREKQANNWANGWMGLAKRLTPERTWRPMVEALIEYFGG